MTIQELHTKLEEKYAEIGELRKQQVTLAKIQGLMEVENYQFKDKEGVSTDLNSLFGDKDELIVIHNMGKKCPYCTLWADGLSSSTLHISDRCGFVLVSPDEFSVMRDFAEDRDWKFPYYSASGTDFIEKMGYSTVNDKGQTHFMPGFTTFVKKEDKIYRVACDTFDPGDFYSPIWHFMDMLYHSDREWSPKYKY